MNYIDELVSIITPVYNAERFLSETLASVFAQTYEKLEVILVDDCSTDGSVEIINSYAKQYPDKVIYYRNQQNVGAGVSRNKALELAKGRYIAFLDSDDIWHEKKLSKQLKKMSDVQAPLCYTAIEMVDELGVQIKSQRDIADKCSYKDLLRNTMIATSSLIVDRYQVGDFRMSARRGGQDYATWLNLLKNDRIAYGINEALVKYRISDNSLSSNKWKSIQQVWEIQTKEQEISKLPAFFNVCYFIGNALKKYFI